MASASWSERTLTLLASATIAERVPESLLESRYRDASAAAWSAMQSYALGRTRRMASLSRHGWTLFVRSTPTIWRSMSHQRLVPVKPRWPIVLGPNLAPAEEPC